MARDLKTGRTQYDRLRRAFWPLALMATITLFSSRSGPQVPWVSWIPSNDKVAHFFVFGLLATHLLRLSPGMGKSRSRAGFTVLLTLLFSISDELHQYANPLRYFELADIAADLLGAVTAVSTYRSWGHYRNLLERRIIPFTRIREGSEMGTHDNG